MKLIYLLILFLCFVITACGSVPAQDSASITTAAGETAQSLTPEDNQALALKDQTATLIYIPKLKIDSKGQVIPYQATPNPYLSWQGFVGSSSVESFNQAQAAYDRGDLSAAEAIAQQLTEKSKKLSGPWVLLGDIAVQKKDYTLAQQHYSKAVELNEENVNAYLRLAKLKRLQGQFIEAKRVYAQALALWKDFPEAHLNLAILYDIYLNDEVKAQKHMEAYQFLTGGQNAQVGQWLLEIQSRTGMAIELNVQKPQPISKPLS